MESFQFNFNFSELPSSADNSGIVTSNKVSNPCKNLSSPEIADNAENKLTATKALEILNVSELLASLRIKTHEKDWKYDEVHLSQEHHNGDQRNNSFNFDPLRRVKIRNSTPHYNSTSSESTDKQNEMDVGGSSRTAEYETKSTVINEKELIENEKTDIITGVYEGGLKVWECSVDLCVHLAQELSRLDREEGDTGVTTNQPKDSDLPHNDIRRAVTGEGGSTWELGCGHGLPGCLIVREFLKRRRQQGRCNTGNDNEGYGKSNIRERGESNETESRDSSPLVLFSDYNDFVLRDVTLPSIVLNTWSPSNCTQTSLTEALDQDVDSLLNSLTCLAAGDWLKLSDRLLLSNDQTIDEGEQILKRPIGGRFDLILGAEVTYSVSSTKDTVLLLLRHLKMNTGIALVATKRYYFGVGGGTDVFTEIATREVISVNEITYGLSIEKVKSYDCGKANIRDLLRIRCIQR